MPLPCAAWGLLRPACAFPNVGQVLKPLLSWFPPREDAFSCQKVFLVMKKLLAFQSQEYWILWPRPGRGQALLGEMRPPGHHTWALDTLSFQRLKPCPQLHRRESQPQPSPSVCTCGRPGSSGQARRVGLAVTSAFAWTVGMGAGPRLSFPSLFSVTRGFPQPAAPSEVCLARRP